MTDRDPDGEGAPRDDDPDGSRGREPNELAPFEDLDLNDGCDWEFIP